MDHQESVYTLVYGAGVVGRRVQSYLRSVNRHVDAFLDANASLKCVNDLPVWSSGDWAKAHDTSKAHVIIGLLNHHVNMPELLDQLETQGYRQISSLIEFVDAYPDEQLFDFWLVDPSYYKKNSQRIANFRAHLADETSRTLLDRTVRFRMEGDYRCLPEPDPYQYFPQDLPAWPQPLRFIDCGSHTGDTVQAMAAAGLSFSSIACFEPNLVSYQTLANNLKPYQAANFPCAVSDTNRLAWFDPCLVATGGTGGHLVEAEGEPVYCLRLDDALPNFSPNLIKMDIEGEELAAVRGAEQILRTYRPGLAIAIYHRADHLWSIFEQIEQYDLAYRYYLRCHAYSTFDTVLYAMPEPMK